MRRRTLIVVLAVVACALVIGPATLLAETIRPALAAGMVLLAAFACGRFLTRDRSLPDALLIGVPLFGTVAGLVAWGGVGVYAGEIAITTALAIGGSLLLIRKVPEFHWPAWESTLLLAIPIGLGLIEAITPVSSPDELVYKLAVPHGYLLEGRMLELPLNSHSYLVMALDLASLPALLLGGGIAAKLVHFALFLCTLAVMQRLARRFVAQPGLVVAAIAWTPALLVVAGWAWHEWAVIGLLLLAFDRLESWLDEAAPGDLMAAAAAAGGAIAVKYTALPAVAVLAVIALIRTPATRRRSLIRAAGIAATVGACFYLRNVIWTGSPIAPLLLPNAPQLVNFRGGGALAGWLDLVHGAYLFDRRYIDEALGLTMPLAAAAGFFALRSSDRRLNDLAWLGAAQLPLLISLAPVPRNLTASLAPLAIAGGVVLARWLALSRARVALLVVTALALAAQLGIAFVVLRSFELFPYLTGKEGASAYIARTRRFAAVYDWIDRNTPATSRVLLLGENRTYYLNRPAIAGGNLDGPRIAAWLSRFPTPAQLEAELRRRGVTHILLHKPWLRAATPGTPPPTLLEREYLLELPPATARTLFTTLNHATALRYRDSDYLVYELTTAR
ncbi:MAG: hypothetical protein JWN02_109 [Acidobacteria bacterium]|nr:hypothetical protein [Acidobacteriota bacterium]